MLGQNKPNLSMTFFPRTVRMAADLVVTIRFIYLSVELHAPVYPRSKPGVMQAADVCL